MFSIRDRELMARAIKLAEKGLNTTTPNPRVGCVIATPDGEIVGEGFHQYAGGPHAEIEALRVAGEKSKGAHAFVSLEPCSHHGKTGPCVEALIEAGVARVVFAMEDPNPQVAAGGLDLLRAAGIKIEGPLMESSARALNPGFIKRQTLGLPFMRLKMAASLDGRTAMASGESKWITGPAARQDVQRLRARSCAIVTGVDSVIHDDPSLTVRLGENMRQPLRIIVDTHGRCPAEAEILNQPGKTIVACSENAELANDWPTWRLPTKDDRVSLYALAKKLADEGCNEVLVETGATLAGVFLGSGLIDEIVIYMAPKILGSDARPMFTLPIDKMSGQLPFQVSDMRAIGHDWRITATPDPEG